MPCTNPHPAARTLSDATKQQTQPADDQTLTRHVASLAHPGQPLALDRQQYHVSSDGSTSLRPHPVTILKNCWIRWVQSVTPDPLRCGRRQEFCVNVRLYVKPSAVHKTLALQAWLSQQDQLRGRVRQAEQKPADGQMGSELAGILVVALGAGGAVSVLAQALVVWCQQPRSHSIRVTVTCPDGTSIEVEGRKAKDVEVALRAGLDKAGKLKELER
jgi:hypothetical protein